MVFETREDRLRGLWKCLFFSPRDLTPHRALATAAVFVNVLPHPAAKHAIAAGKTS